MAEINEWLTIDKTSGEGDATITLTTNTSTSIREKVYGLKIKGISKNVVLNVKQEAFIVNFKLNSYKVESQQEGGVFANGVTSNVPWVAEVNGGWIKMDVKNGESGYTPFNITLNTCAAKREGEVVFKTIDGDILASLKVIQLGDINTEYFWIEFEEPNGSVLHYSYLGTKRNLLYSFDGFNWHTEVYDGSKARINMNENTLVYIYCDNRDGNFSTTNDVLICEKRARIGGKLSALTDNYAKGLFSAEKFSIQNFITDASLLDLSGVFPYFSELFAGCHLLSKPPILTNIDYISTQLVSFDSMFYKCTSLVQAPELPNLSYLNGGVFHSMFFKCTSLVQAPELPFTNLSRECYAFMFAGCTSLVQAPELPATTLADYCYSNMFYGCTSLKNAPQLPATTLADDCYENMFEGCTSLVNAPELPATVLDAYSYYRMFYGCTSLSYIKMLATNIGPIGCLSNWVKNVSPTGTFVKHPDANIPIGVNGIPEGWTVETATS